MTNTLIAARDRFAQKYPEQRIDLNGRNWGYLDVGEGPVLLLIPGTLGRCDIFWHQFQALMQRIRIIALSYPETGGIAEWGDDIATLMDHQKVQTATVLGSSLGGYLAQYVAAKHPHRVDRLVAANTLASVVGLNQRPPYSLDLETAPIDDLRAGFATGLEAWRTAHPDQSDLVDLLLMEVGGRIPEPELRRRLDALKHAPALPPLALPADSIVTIEADDDPLIPPQMRASVRTNLQPAVAYRFLHGGHFPYIARPKAYTALLEQIMGLNITGPEWGTMAERAL